MFQKQASKYQDIAPGFEGQIARSSATVVTEAHVIYDSANPILPGSFVVGEPTTDKKTLKFALLSKGNIENKVILGVVIYEGMKQMNLSSKPSFGNGQIVSVLTHGAIWIKNTGSDCNPGEYVYLKKSDGTLAFDKNPTKNDHYNTGFNVIRGGKKNELIIIETL